VVESGQRQLLLDISEEVGAWHDHGLLGFACTRSSTPTATSTCFTWSTAIT